MAAGSTIGSGDGAERHRRVRRKAILVWAGTIPLTLVALEAWIYWRLLMCQTEFFVNHYDLCRSSGILPLLPELILLVAAVLIVFDLAAIADIKGEAPGKKPRFYHGFRALDDRRHRSHVAAAGILLLSGWVFVALLMYFMFWSHLLLW
jgi:hypothetical protein